jgi:hypothetical protein
MICTFHGIWIAITKDVLSLLDESENGKMYDWLNHVYVGYHTRKITLPVMPLTVPVTLPIQVMSAACTGSVHPFI